MKHRMKKAHTTIIIKGGAKSLEASKYLTLFSELSFSLQIVSKFEYFFQLLSLDSLGISQLLPQVVIFLQLLFDLFFLRSQLR